MAWNVIFIREATKDLRDMDPFTRKVVLKAISKTAERPLPPPEGIGKPLGNHSGTKLSGFFKIKLKALGYRVIYKLQIEGRVMKVIVISIRVDDRVYKEAQRRIGRGLDS